MAQNIIIGKASKLLRSIFIVENELQKIKKGDIPSCG
jgi:hypothetical protein